MVGQSIVNRTFAGGELSPSLQARADQVKYQTSVNLARNYIVRRDGTIWNRSGTGFMREVDDSTKQHRVIRWIFNNSLSYVLELGDYTMRFIQNGVPITEAPAAWVNVTAYTAGDSAEFGGINYIALQDTTGAQPDLFPTIWYAWTGEIVEIPTPWSETEIFDVKFDQQGNIMYLVHPDHEIQKLQRNSSISWVMTSYVPITGVARDIGFTVAGTVAGTLNLRYAVTAVLKDTFEESLFQIAQSVTITAITAANPVSITTAVPHTWLSGDTILINQLTQDGGMIELNNREFTITVTGAATFTLDDEDGTAYTAYVSGGGANKISKDFTAVANPTPAAQVTITTASLSSANYPNVAYFNVYKDQGTGEFGYIGSTDSRGDSPSFFRDTGISPDTSVTPPKFSNLFNRSGDYPSTIQFFQQRLGLANSNNKPENIWLSRIGQYENFTTSDVVRPDDAISFGISGRRIEAVKHLVDIGRLMTLTSGGEWLLGGDENGTLRPTAINANEIDTTGADKLTPVRIGGMAIYAQERSQQIRSIIFDNDIQGFNSDDLSKWAQHLFDGRTIVEWDYQQLPHSVVWMVMSDGALVSLTFILDEGIVAFCRHDTLGEFESVCVVPEGNEDVPYFVIRRDIDGNSVRYTERMASRIVTDVATDAYFSDSFATYDGNNTGATTLTLSGGPPWGVDDIPYTLTASASEFVAGDVGNAYVLRSGSDSIKLTITAYNSATDVDVSPSKDVPVAFQGVAILDWCKAVDEFTGLDHLEGETVVILADGNVLDTEVVTGGAITVDDTYCVAHIGLGYYSDLETLDVESLDSTLLDKKKRVNNMTIIIENSRGGWAGPDEANLTEMKQLTPAFWQQPTATLLTGRYESILKGRWLEKGKLFIRQKDPLPLHIIALVPHGTIGE